MKWYSNHFRTDSEQIYFCAQALYKFVNCFTEFEVDKKESKENKVHLI